MAVVEFAESSADPAPVSAQDKHDVQNNSKKANLPGVCIWQLPALGNHRICCTESIPAVRALPFRANTVDAWSSRSACRLMSLPGRKKYEGRDGVLPKPRLQRVTAFCFWLHPEQRDLQRRLAVVAGKVFFRGDPFELAYRPPGFRRAALQLIGPDLA